MGSKRWKIAILSVILTRLSLNGADKNTKFQRMIPCDTGLELIKAASCYKPLELFCWQRSANPGSAHGNAQVDFLVQKGSRIIPIEVKSGTQGGMQSLRLFMKEKNIERGVRTSLENFRRFGDIDVYPLYAIGNILRG